MSRPFRVAAATDQCIRVTHGWQVLTTAPGAAASPEQIGGNWHPATVPGIAASALRGIVDEAELNRLDVWYRVLLPPGEARDLVFHGLATIAEIWLAGRCVLQTDNMFRTHHVPVSLAKPTELHLCFRALHPALAAKRGRARWRTAHAQPGTLRHARTTLLGQMPGRFPEFPVVGPWRAIELRSLVPAASLTCAVRDSAGIATLSLNLPEIMEAAPGYLRIGENQTPLDWLDARNASAELTLPDVALWWPHTHGDPALHEATLQLGDATISLGRVGFRTISVDRDADGQGFGLVVNATPVFCRGASWISADLQAFPEDAAAFAPFIDAACAAGMNMLRVGGTTIYEADAFYDLCAERGILVWQDFMFANFDYPKDAGFLQNAACEAEQFLDRTQSCPALAVLCGASEVSQQIGMMGLPSEWVRHELFDAILPGIAERLRPDVPYLGHAPDGPGWSFAPDRGVSHYYGIGAYLRDTDDARRSGLRFAAECLGFANVPDQRTLAALGTPDVHDPRWKSASPRDPGAPWDFDDVRDHYLGQFFGVIPAVLRMRDRDRYLDLARATSATVMHAAFAEWRRPRSSCRGALVWTLQDVVPGAGWGVLDHAGRPKAAWHGLRAVLQPVQVLLTDEGLNGLDVHVLNETPRELRAEFELVCLRDGTVPVARATCQVTLAAHASQSLRSAELLDGFFDITYAYRFGPPAHDVTIATLRDAAGQVLSQAVHFPAGQVLPPCDPGFEASLAQDAAGWVLTLSCARFAQFVHIVDENFRAEADWFHLAPNSSRAVRLLRECEGVNSPDGYILALNALRWKRYSGRQ